MLAMRQYSTASLLLLLSLPACDDRQPLEPAVEAASSGGGPPVNAPSNTSASAVSESRIDVSWQDNSDNETGFEVHRSTTGASGPFALLTSTAANVTSYGNVGLTPSTEYCYQVRAFRTTGRRTSYSAFSATACATTTVPAAPSSADAKPIGSTAVMVTWVDNSTTEEGFRVERSLDGGACLDLGATWTSAGTTGPNVTSLSDYGRASEQQVRYRIIARHSRGDSPPSNTDCATPPAAPSDLAATGTPQPAIDLTWMDNSAVENGYAVWRAELGTGFIALAGLPANSQSYHDAAAMANTRYWYMVRATQSDGGVSDFSSSASAIAVTAPPAAPSGMNATPQGSTAIMISWTDQSANEAGFRVERSLDGGASWTVAGTTEESAVWFTDEGRTSEQQVCYRVFAFNTIGDSPASNSDCTTPPAAPSGLVAIAVAGSAIDLTWTDNSGLEDAYRVHELFQQCGYYYCYDWVVVIATVGPNVTRYRHAGLNPSEFHRYQVVALKDGGASDPSNEAGATTLP